MQQRRAELQCHSSRAQALCQYRASEGVAGGHNRLGGLHKAGTFVQK